MLKFGQWISMRPDMFPRDLCEMCANLRQNAPTHEFHLTRDMIRESFGMEVEEIFEKMDRMPVASGCVGQVYRARLRDEYVLANGDRDVAVKIRHPSVRRVLFIIIFFGLENKQTHRYWKKHTLILTFFSEYWYVVLERGVGEYIRILRENSQTQVPAMNMVNRLTGTKVSMPFVRV